MSLKRTVVLRYRSAGHVRFAIPAALCRTKTAMDLERRIAALDGVRQVDVYRRQKKLSIRYNQEILSFSRLAGALAESIEDVAAEAAAEHHDESLPRRTGPLRERLANLRGVRWAREKYQETSETVAAARVLANRAFKHRGGMIEDPEQTAITFINDILVFYLIKIHWVPITQRWLPHPIRYRYEWMTVIYLIYLLMRSRRKG